MSIGDIVIVGIGLLAGWSIVSLIFRTSGTGELRKLGEREFSIEELENGWPAMLQVSASAPAEQIDAACRLRLEALRQSFPAVMTDVEVRNFNKASAVLQRACRLAMADRNVPSRNS